MDVCRRVRLSLLEKKKGKKNPSVFLCKAQIFNEGPVLQERESLARRQMLEEERRRREEAEKRLQDETFHRQQLVEKEVKLRAKNFSQVSPTLGSASLVPPKEPRPGAAGPHRPLAVGGGTAGFC